MAPTPIKMLSINGSLLIDQGNKNAGNVDSGALRFGTSALIGISNNQAAAGNNPQGMDFGQMELPGFLYLLPEMLALI